MTLDKQFCSYEQALALKELGFDEPCWSYFITPFDDGEGIFNPSMFLKDYAYLDTMPKHSTYILAPLKSQAFEWFIDKYNIHHALKPVIGSKCNYDSYPILGWDFDLFISNKNSDKCFYMGHLIGEWFTATLDRFDEGDSLEDLVKFYSRDEVDSKCIDAIIEIIKNQENESEIN